MRVPLQAGPNTWYLPGSTNMGLYVSGTDAYLIDTGLVPEDTAPMLDFLAERRLTLRAILHTHAHTDHIGGDWELQQSTGCPVYLSASELPFAEHRKLMGYALLSGDLPQTLDRPSTIPSHDLVCCDLASAPLPDGFCTELLPGHSVGSTAIRTPDGVWFSGDILLPAPLLERYHLPNLFNIAQQLQSLSRVSMLTGPLFIPGHGDAVSELLPMVALNRRAVEWGAQFVLSQCSGQATREDVLQGALRDYGRPAGVNRMLILNITIGAYLAYWQDQGRLECVPQNGKLIYRFSQTSSCPQSP